MLTVAVLGPVEIHRDGVRLPLPSGKTTEVLVRLALDAGRMVHADRLIDDLWGPAAAATGKNTLQSKVSQLRRALGDADLLISGNGGYTLCVEPENVDALHVAGLATGVGAARRSGDARAALDLAAKGWRCSGASCPPVTGSCPTGCGWRRSASGFSRTTSPHGSTWAPAAR